MNEHEMQAAVDQLVKDMLDKGLRKPEVRVWIQANKEPCVGVVSGVYSEGDRMAEYPSAPNANLIAAAPDMLAALENVVAWADHQVSLFGAYDESLNVASARAAIAKAQGVK